MTGYALVPIIQLIFQLFNLLILARILIGWANLSPYHPITQFLHRTTEPFLEPVRRVLPPVSMFDFSPIVVIIIASILEQILIRALIG